MIQGWRLDVPGQTIALVSDQGAMPVVVWWGKTLRGGEDLAALFQTAQRDLTGGMLDVAPPLSILPETGRTWQGQPGLIATRGGLPLLVRFGGTTGHQAGNTLTLTARDDANGLSATMTFTGYPSGLIGAKTQITADQDIEISWLAAPVMPASEQSDEIWDVAGRWIGEFQIIKTPWTPGVRLREARTGRSGHEHPPYAIIPDRGADDVQGTVRALHYGWSGGHRMVAEELPDGRRQLQFGHASQSMRPGRQFQTAELLLSCGTGLNGVAVPMQRHIRDTVVRWPDPSRPRPVHYNCWEAVYFKHDLATLTQIADRAAEIGAERFVLDDGWFGRRDDDTTSLGDWTIDHRKWPDGLGPLIDHVKAKGMTFGLWFEPEMINADSDLARAHPEWILGPLDQVTGRQQLVLDLSLAPVRDNLFAQISAILGSHDIDYVKWDHNRLLPYPDAAQTDGVYDLFDRLRVAFPMVEFESCASGGGRIDAGILARTSRVWLSDSNDALERLRIQHDAALFLPAAVTGSHVGPRVCHTSGRILPMAFRAWVAAQRHLGFEMDLRELDADETKTLTEITAWYRANRDWMHAGDILRLASDDPSITAELQRSADGARFVVFAGQSAALSQILPRPLRLTGLDPEARYSLTLRNRPVTWPSRGPNALKSGAVVLSGQVLMERGVPLPVGWPATMWVIEGHKV